MTKPPRQSLLVDFARNLRRMMRFAWPFRRTFVLVIALSGVYALLFQGRLVLLGPLIDKSILGSQTDAAIAQLFDLVLILLAITAVQGPIGFLRHYVSERVARRVFLGLQRHVQQHLLRLDMGFWVRHRHGDLVSRVTGDLASMMSAIGFTAEALIVQSFMLVLGLGIAIYASWQLALACTIVMPLLALGLGWLSRKTRYWSRKTAEAGGKVLNNLTESMAGMRVVKAFRREEHAAQRFAEVTQVAFERGMTQVKYGVISLQGADVVYNLLLCALIAVGGWMLISGWGGLTLGAFVMFLAAMVASADPLRRLTRAINMYQAAFAAADRVFEVLDLSPHVVEAPAPTDHPRLQREIVFDNVGFSYAEAARAAGSLVYADTVTSAESNGLLDFRLDGVSFTARRGEVIALVGERGSGKSTVLDLLLRLYDPTAGRITIDGHDLRQLSFASLRALFATVTQETFLFHATIASNIAYGKPGATHDEIRQAAADANILEFIERQPEGFNTLVGERGSRLSGGERQSIAIARAILANAPILVLDEATSNLDSVSERRIQQALERLMADRTVFVVAHRLSTIRHATRIIAMQRGRIIETGSHDELIAADGLYAHLHRTQFATAQPTAAALDNK